MPSPKRQAVICHKIAALSYLLAEALDELNPEVADSNPFKKQCDAMADKCNEIVSDVFGVQEIASYISSKHEYQVDTAIRRNYVRIWAVSNNP
jgi:hypothetical protein